MGFGANTVISCLTTYTGVTAGKCLMGLSLVYGRTYKASSPGHTANPPVIHGGDGAGLCIKEKRVRATSRSLTRTAVVPGRGAVGPILQGKTGPREAGCPKPRAAFPGS